MWNHRAIKRGPHLVQFPFTHEKNMTSKPQPKKTTISPSCEADPNHPSHTWRGSWWIHMGHWIWVILLKNLEIAAISRPRTVSKPHHTGYGSKPPKNPCGYSSPKTMVIVCDYRCQPILKHFGAMLSGFLMFALQIEFLSTKVLPGKIRAKPVRSSWCAVKFSSQT